jgi:hypothetical protein
MGEQQQERSEESLRHEYTEAVQHIRHYSNLRFAVFSIFFAVMGGVGFVAFGKGEFDPNAAEMTRIAGIFVIAIFWLYEESLSEFFEHYVRVSLELGHALGYTPRPATGVHFPRTMITFRLFFAVVALLWLYAVFAVSLGS